MKDLAQARLLPLRFGLRTLFAVMIGVAIGLMAPKVWQGVPSVLALFSPPPPPQVMVQVEAVQLPATELSNLQIDWHQHAPGSLRATAEGDSISKAVELLVRQNKATHLGRPQMMTISGVPAVWSTSKSKGSVRTTLLPDNRIELSVQVAGLTSARGMDAKIEVDHGGTLLLASSKLPNGALDDPEDTEMLVIVTAYSVEAMERQQRPLEPRVVRGR